MKIAITQRVVPSGPGGARCDMLDQRWFPFLASCGIEAVPVPNLEHDPVGFVERAGCRGLLLSGGNNLSRELWPHLAEMDDTAPERDALENILVSALSGRGWPILGVCRGMQLLNAVYGGGLRAVEGHAGQRHELHLADPLKSLLGEERIVTNSFHRVGLGAAELAPGLRPLAMATDGTVEAFCHEALPHYGMMWHPERPLDESYNRKIMNWIWSSR